MRTACIGHHLAAFVTGVSVLRQFRSAEVFGPDGRSYRSRASRVSKDCPILDFLGGWQLSF